MDPAIDGNAESKRQEDPQGKLSSILCNGPDLMLVCPELYQLPTVCKWLERDKSCCMCLQLEVTILSAVLAPGHQKSQRHVCLGLSFFLSACMSEVDAGHLLQSNLLIFLRQSFWLNLELTHLTRLAGLQVSPLISTSPNLKFQTCTTAPGFLRRLWRRDWGLCV